MKALMDFIGRGQHQGDLAALALEGRINPDFMRPYVGDDGQTYYTVYTGKDQGDKRKAADFRCYSRDQMKRQGIAHYGTLRRDEWIALDQAVQQACAIRLGGIDDLRSRGLVFNLGNAIGTTVFEWHKIGQAMEAEVSMDPEVRSTKDRVTYSPHYTPIPLIHSDFSISSRTLAASRALGNALDTDSIFEATRVVNEKLESMLFNTDETPTKFAGGYIYSYLDHPSRNQYTISTAWDNASKTGAQILADVQGMIQMSINARHYGPWVLYIPTGYQTAMGNDYQAGYPKTIRARLLELEGLEDIKVIDTLPTAEVVLVEMQPRTVRLIVGMSIQVIQWQVGHQLSPTDFKVVTIQVPQVRDDKNSRCGVTHGAASFS